MTAKEIGDAGERLVCGFISNLGMEILGRNYRSIYGEIDIIARDGDCVAFIEVKSRKNARFAQAREFVTAAKRRKIKLTASCWLAGRAGDFPARFDVAEVYGGVRVNYVKDAFI